MNWPRLVGVLLISLGVTGCASSARRLSPAALSSQPAAGTPAVVAHAQDAPPPGEPDIFMAAKATRESSAARLSRYFPGLGRTTPVSPATSAPVAARSDSALPSGRPVAVAAAAPARSSWFASRKARGPQTYVTDVRGPATRATAEPAYLPVALQVPADRVKDRAVTVTAAEEAAQVAESAVAAQSGPQAGNPDSSSAPAEPLRTDEPRLAVKPFGTPEVTPPVAPTTPDLEAKPAEPEAKEAEPAATPPAREQPEATPAPEPAAQVASAENTQVAPPTPDPNPGTPRGPAAGPTSAADPGNSLGLPPAMLPATYTQHHSVAVRGSYQGSQPRPQPVLASPQVEASPQSASVATTGGTKTWQRPCFRRMIRRQFKLGEFASPPTAQPH